MLSDHQRATNYLQQVVLNGALDRPSELQRSDAETLIGDALYFGDFSPEITKRLKRLKSSLSDASKATSQTKIDLLRDTIVPTLVALGVAEEV